MTRKIIFIFAFVILLCGCSAAQQQPTPPPFVTPPPEVTLPGGFSMQDGKFAYGEGTTWPDYIPADIPPIPADITSVMADGRTVRIFFNNMPKDAFEGYLALLYQGGFSLEFVVYETPGVSQEDVERFIREGKYDAVRIKKIGYSMYIEYGADMGTYDIDLPEGTIIKSKVEWPAELTGILNQPAGSEVTNVLTVGGSMDISCESENTNLFSDYCMQLEAEGFIKGRTSIDQNQNVTGIEYTKGDIFVGLINFKPGAISIQYNPAGNNGYMPQISGMPTMPAMPSQEWPDILPEFTDGKILLSVNTDEKTTNITIQCTSEALDNYERLLLDSGFTLQGDNVYSNSDCTVKIMALMNSNNVTLTVTLKN